MTKKKPITVTQEDIRLLMEMIGTTQQEVFNMKKHIKDSEDRSQHFFLVALEDLRHDMIGTHKDKIQNHEDRIVKLERKTGLATAA